MQEERRGRQNTILKDGRLTSNIAGYKGNKKDGHTFLNRWQRISLRSQQDKTCVFQNLMLHINVESLTEAFKALDGSKALGMDGVSKQKYQKNLASNLESLVARIRRGVYRPKPKREVLIPKANGKTRPIAIACLEDKLVDWVVGRILTEIYEPEFIKTSLGFRPGKSCHQAIEASYHNLKDNKRPHVVEIDFSSFFNTIPHKQLMQVIERRVQDVKFKAIVRRFLKGATLHADGQMRSGKRGTPQGGIMSPILANIYLNEVVDQWFIQNYNRHNCRVVRYADDAVFFFKEENEAKQFLEDFTKRVEEYGLSLNKEKTSLLHFDKAKRNDFSFLGFTFYWGRHGARRLLKVKTQKEKHLKAIREFYNWIKETRNQMKLSKLWELAKAKLRGHYNYFGYWCNRSKLNHFYFQATKSLYKWLNRRSQKRSYNWDGFKERLKNQPLPIPPERRQLKRLGKVYGL